MLIVDAQKAKIHVYTVIFRENYRNANLQWRDLTRNNYLHAPFLKNAYPFLPREAFKWIIFLSGNIYKYITLLRSVIEIGWQVSFYARQ